MKILVITQAVDINDPALGFFHDWLLALASRVECITVICLRKGAAHLPSNVRVFSLGKEKGVSKITYLFRFYKYLLRERRQYDSVFVHMNPEYVCLGGLLWRLMGKRVVLWYTHRQVTAWLRVAVFFAHTILTAAPESFRLQTKKIRVLGHGIETKKFGAVFKKHKELREPLRIISVGRITPIKNLEILIEAISLLRNEGLAVVLECIGAPITKKDTLYFEQLRSLISKRFLEDVVQFSGAVPQVSMAEAYSGGDFSVNLAPEGGIDKSVLESMASGVIPLTSNKAFKAYFGEDAGLLIFKERNASDLAEHIKALSQSFKLEEIRGRLKETAEREAGIDKIIQNIVNYL